MSKVRLFPLLLILTAATPEVLLTCVEDAIALACTIPSLTMLLSTAVGVEEGIANGARLLLGDLRSGKLPKSFSKSFLEVNIDLGSEVMKEEGKFAMPDSRLWDPALHCPQWWMDGRRSKVPHRDNSNSKGEKGQEEAADSFVVD